MAQDIPLERTEEERIREWAKAEGGEAVKLKVDGERGFPDRTIFLPGRIVIFIEAKRRKGGVVSPQQTRWVNKLRSWGFRAEVVKTLEEVQKIVAEERACKI